MHAVKAAFLMLLAAIAVLGAPAPAQEPEAMREISVKEILAGCKGADAAKIWRQADLLIKLRAPAKRYIRQNIKDAPVEARLAGLRALIGLDSPTYAAEKLMDIASDDDTKEVHRILALELVGQTEEIDVEESLVELLVTYNPNLRIAAARALWALDGDQAHKSKTALVEFLRSADPDLRAQGALALAEMGDFVTPGVREMLTELRKQPGDRGKLANALYQKLQLQRVIDFYEREADRTKAATRTTGPWRHLNEITDMLKKHYDHTDKAPEEPDLRKRAASGMVRFPDDPHTVFLTPKDHKQFLHGRDGVDPSYGGIGAFINTSVTNRFEILRPIFGGPAWNSDLRGGDVIVAVNGTPTRGRSTTDIIKQVKGPPGTTVILTVVREGWHEAREIKVIRAKIVLPTVVSRMLPGKIGYITIAQFSYETGKELKKALDALEAQDMRGLVLDMRNNPGGALRAVKDCLGLFLRGGELICTIKGRVYPPERHTSGKPDRARDYPISVLINSVSASGSELMSGVLQHYSKTSKLTAVEDGYLDALVLGEASFGKGTVQHTLPLQTWPGERFKDTPRKNGRRDFGEDYTDINGNGRWDRSEPFGDEARTNRRWDDAEPWVDKNGNGTHDPDEEFTDQNGDGEWNPGETYEDANGNNEYDYGAALKLTVARYYLPSGTNFTRRRIYNEATKKYEHRGGVEPDIKVSNHRWGTAHLAELRELQTEGAFRDYARKHWTSDQQKLTVLAWFDAREPSRYPEFDAFFDSLNTRLTRQEVRLALRIAVRREVMARSGKEIIGDLSDDRVLLRGVIEIFGRLGENPADIPEYRSLNGTNAK